MAAGRYNIEIDQGSDYSLNLNIKEAGVVKDLSGYSARGQIRKSKTSNDVSASFTCTVLTPATDGNIKIELRNSVSSLMSAGLYYYDIEIYTANDSIVKRIIQGELVLCPEVTR